MVMRINASVALLRSGRFSSHGSGGSDLTISMKRAKVASEERFSQMQKPRAKAKAKTTPFDWCIATRSPIGSSWVPALPCSSI